MSDSHTTIERLQAQVAELRSQLKQLSRSKERQRRLYQDTPAMLHSISPEGRLVEVNNHWLRVMGYQRHEVLGRYILDFWPPEHRARVEQHYMPRFMEQGHIDNVPGQMITKSGKLIDIVLSAITERDGQGNMIRSLSVTQVVTDRKQAEAALKASEARFRRIIETAMEGVWEVDDQGMTSLVNQRLAAMLGYEPEEIIGRPFLEFLAPDQVASAKEMFRRHCRGAQEHREFRLLSKDGQDRWAIVSATPYLGEQGEYLGGTALITDISELKNKESELRRERDRAQQYLDTAQVILLALDSRGRVLLINRAGSAILGYSVTELTGKDWFETCLPPDRSSEVRRVFESIVKGEAEPLSQMENLVLTKDGQRRTVVWHNAVLTDDAGAVVGTFSSGEDISEQLQAQKDLAASEARFRELVENIKEAFWVQEPDSGKLLYLSPAVEEVFGLSRRFLYENPLGLLELVLPEDRSVMERALADQRMRGADTDVAFRIQRGDGQVRWVRSRTTCETDEQGRAVKVLGIAEDITERKQAELALAKSQEKFALVFRNSPLWVTISTLEDGVYLDVNDTFSHITGFTRQEVLGRSSSELGVWSDPARREEAVALIKKHGGLKDFDIDYITRDGQLRHALWSAESVVIDGRNCLISVLRDITRRKLAEKALRQANAALEMAQEMAGLGSWSVELGSRWPLWSDRMYQILGRDPGMGPPEWGELLRLVHPDDRERFERAVQEIAETGEPRNLEVRVVRPEGSVRSIAIRSHVQRDDQGKAVRLHGIVRDITERRRSEEALKASEEQFRRLFEDAALGIFQSTAEGTIIRVNPALARMLGYSSPDELMELTQRRASNCYADLSRRDQVLEMAKASQGPVRVHTLYRRKDGSTFTGMQHLRLVRGDEGQPLRLEGLVEDVSRQLESERLQQALERQLRHASKMEAVGTLAGGIAHDFNNLLARIMGYCELAGADLEPGHPSQKSLQELMDASHRAKNLVRQLLDFSHSARDKQLPTRLDEVLDEAVRLLGPHLPEGIELEVRTAPGLIALADPGQLHQMLSKLWDNAVQAMEGRLGVLRLSLDRVELEAMDADKHPGLQAGPHARLVVQDTGTGMSPEVAEQAFDPFFTTREVGQGHGMGLAVVHGIAKSHGGAVSLESETGRGATFTVLLPLTDREQQEPDPA
ncbi:MAG: PAS domain S-box protein [Desulfarculaceae bacterium]|nr:PAS domain S-box protein [Desulfarculaceae bacterium]MCF8072482.1 PAS domain S-box protein [Desulfarculaceae bacterium]MCF8102943.1 PAS domain S-box protein [Desulfarculaceae bacterium]MCF8117454.1 PAS domain S-box protein [Desulfarculaceae bacterium]